MVCEECNNEMTLINGISDSYFYCFCCGNVQETPVIATQINVSGVAISTTT